MHLESSISDQARDEVTGESDEEGVGIDGDHSDGVKDVGPPLLLLLSIIVIVIICPPSDIPNVSGHWPPVVNQQLLSI